MTSPPEGDWVRQGTPRDDNTDWNQEQSEYGTALSPTEWDDYSSEQAVPVPAPRDPGVGVTTASSPGTASERDVEPGQEPDSAAEYRFDDTAVATEDEPALDADDSGVEPDDIEVPDQRGASAVVPEPDHEVAEATSRPRPIVPDASMTAVGAMGPAAGRELPDSEADIDDETDIDDEAEMDVDAELESDASNVDAHEAVEHDVDAAQYLAVDPVPAESALRELSDDDDDDDDDDDGDGDEDPLAAGSPEHVGRGDDDAVTTPVEPLDADFEGDSMRDEHQGHDIDDDDMEATQAVPVAVVAADPETTGTIPEDLYRAGGAEPTAVIAEAGYPDVDVEEERQQARLDAERQAREQRLGAVATSPENARRDDAGGTRVITDKFFPSLSLFVLRLVTASILGVISWQILRNGVDATANYLSGFPLIPEPRLVAWVLGFTLAALALLLVIGLLQRIVGLILLVVAAASLIFIRWGTNFSILQSGVEGFMGDRDLLLAAIGLLLLGIGGGRWGIDGAFRASRAASRAEREG